MKKFILILTILLMGLCSNATENYLHTIILEGTNDGYNIVLKSDSKPVVKKYIKGSDNLSLDIKGITTSKSVNAIYKNTDEINSLVVENISNNEIKIYITAKDIANATILSQTKNAAPIILSERFPVEKVIWSIAVLFILAFVIKSAKSITDYENSITIKKDIKQREIELYKNFQRELDNMPKINSKISNSYASNVMLRSRRNYKELARK